METPVYWASISLISALIAALALKEVLRAAQVSPNRGISFALNTAIWLLLPPATLLLIGRFALLAGIG